jgi:hypothetical protein
MNKRRGLARVLLALLCTFGVVTGFVGAAHADGDTAAGDGSRKWEVTSNCGDGRGWVWATYQSADGEMQTHYTSFPCSGHWSAHINWREGASQLVPTYQGDIPADRALAQVPQEVNPGGPSAERFNLRVDCTGGQGTATLYYDPSGDGGGHTVISTTSIDCHGVHFAWSILF